MTTPFAIAPAEMFQDHRLTLIETRILGILFTFRDKNTNVCYPHRSVIAERAGYSENAVSRGIKGLRDKGWMEVQQRRGSNVYRVIVPDLDTVAEPATVSDPATVAEPATDTVAEPATPKQTTEQTKEPPIVPLAGFDEFRAAWPKGKWKGGIEKPQQSWKKHKCAEHWQLIVADVKCRQRDDRLWLEGYIPLPTTYLNQERWTDDIDTRRPNNPESNVDTSDYFDPMKFPIHGGARNA